MASRNAPFPDTATHILQAEFIPLRPRHLLGEHDERGSTDSESDIFPDSDTAYIRRHRDDELSEDGSVETQPRKNTFFGRITAFIMSRTPLLIRSSPALGTSSYGAVPVADETDNSV